MRKEGQHGGVRALILHSGVPAREALGVQAVPQCMADPKAASHKFIRENFGQHCCMWRSIADMESGADCAWPNHAACRPPAPHTTDILVASGPCQPFSTMRRGVGTEGARPEQHTLHRVTFGESGSVVSFAAEVLAHVFVSEQVEGFRRPAREGAHADASPHATFVAQMLSIRDERGSQWYTANITVTLNATPWLQGSRPRCHATPPPRMRSGDDAPACLHMQRGRP